MGGFLLLLCSLGAYYPSEVAFVPGKREKTIESRDRQGVGAATRRHRSLISVSASSLILLIRLSRLDPTALIRPFQLGRCCRVADHLFLRRVPAQFASQTQRQIGQMTDRADPMSALQIGYRLLPRLDASRKLRTCSLNWAGLLRLCPGDFFGPKLRPAFEVHRRLRAANGMAGAAELRHRVFRRYLAVRRHRETIARSCVMLPLVPKNSRP